MMLVSTDKKVLILTAIFFTAACASHTPPPSSHTVMNAEIKHARDYQVQGEYEQALAIYAETYALHRNKDLRDRYLQAGNEIKTDGDTAFQNADFAKAGVTYKALLNSGVTVEDTVKALSFDEEYLKKQIRACADKLMEKGVMLYRQENLNEAIATWKKILSFDPGNQSAMKSVDTANRQLRILKNIKE